MKVTIHEKIKANVSLKAWRESSALGGKAIACKQIMIDKFMNIKRGKK